MESFKNKYEISIEAAKNKLGNNFLDTGDYLEWWSDNKTIAQYDKRDNVLYTDKRFTKKRGRKIGYRKPNKKVTAQLSVLIEKALVDLVKAQNETQVQIIETALRDYFKKCDLTRS